MGEGGGGIIAPLLSVDSREVSNELTERSMPEKDVEKYLRWWNCICFNIKASYV